MSTATGTSTATEVFEADAAAIAFPLGGVGTGNVSVGARGDLRDWEIEGTAAKGSRLPNAFFGVWVRDNRGETGARVLEGPMPVEPQLSHGHHPTTHAGVARFARSRFSGEYPIGSIRFSDPALPVEVESTFYTPLIPLDPDESGLPVAIFDVVITNISDGDVEAAVSASMINPVGEVTRDPWGAPAGTRFGTARNRGQRSEGLSGVIFDNPALDSSHLRFGQVALLTDHRDATVKPHWRRGGWWDEVRGFWQDFGADGALTDEGYESLVGKKPDTGSVAAGQTVAAGESATMRFYLAWYFPNCRNGWCAPENIPEVWDGASPLELTRKHYATRFGSVHEVAQYVHANRSRLHAVTHAFRAALHDSTVPRNIIRPVSANILPLRTPTTFWLEDGGFHGWEGCFDDAGCCAGTCTHVWSYAYTGAYLFPELERRMRSIEFLLETDADGYTFFRAHRTFGEEMIWQWGDRRPEPAIDGHMGSVVRTWREYCLSGDRAWLARIWPSLRRAVDFACRQWDSDDDGVIAGAQHNTYDIEFWGPNPLAQFMFLAGLEAAARIAAEMGDDRAAELYSSRAAGGARASGDLLWSGDYFAQVVEDVDAHPYQHGRGCLADQLLGALHCRALGLSDIVDAAKRTTAYRAIMDNNFRPALEGHDNYQRVYANNAQGGLLQCAWPDHNDELERPFPYSDETWPGTEYHVAAGMLYEGLIDEALTVLAATAARHDGYAANPWDEIECGHHYARSMSSWLLLLAATGQQTSSGQSLSFDPIKEFFIDGRFRALYSDGRSWGTISVAADGAAVLTVLGGHRIPSDVTLGPQRRPVAVHDARITHGPTRSPGSWTPTIPASHERQGCR